MKILKYQLIIVILLLLLPIGYLVKLNIKSVSPVKQVQKDKLRVQTGWIINGEFAPICSAIVNGYYDKQNLDVELVPGGPSGASFIIATNAIAQDPRLDIAIEGDAVPLVRGVSQEKESERLKMKAIASFWTESPYGFIVKADSALKSLKDFAKRKPDGSKYKIGVTSDFALKDALASYAGVPAEDLNFVTVGFDATPFLTGQVDALAAYWTTQAYEVEKAGIKYRFLTIGEVPGLSQPSMIIQVTDQVLANKRDQIKHWLKATQQGVEFVAENASESAKQIRDSRCGGEKLDVIQEEWLIRKSIPLFTRAPKIGALDDQKIDAFAKVFEKIKQIPFVPKPEDYLDTSIMSEL